MCQPMTYERPILVWQPPNADRKVRGSAAIRRGPVKQPARPAVAAAVRDPVALLPAAGDGLAGVLRFPLGGPPERSALVARTPARRPAYGGAVCEPRQPQRREQWQAARRALTTRVPTTASAIFRQSVQETSP